MSLTATYDPQLSRVRLTWAAQTNAAYAVLERTTDGIVWEVVRGGFGVPIVGDAAAGPELEQLERPVDDYEFTPDVPNTYRFTPYDDAGVPLGWTHTRVITPTLEGRPWLKVIARPYLNRPVTVLDYGEVSRPARAGVFDVVDAALPVVVSGVRAGRRFALALVTETPSEAETMEYALAGGETVLLQVPADCDVPAGYLHVGDLVVTRPSRRSVRRVFSAPVVEVPAPAPDVVGATSSWQTVLNNYTDWTAVQAAHPTWADLLELIGNPGDVITA